jgi:hypothetical protein
MHGYAERGKIVRRFIDIATRITRFSQSARPLGGLTWEKRVLFNGAAN